MRRSRKALVICTVVMLCALIVCTFLSKSIYNARLPAVETETVQRRELSASYYAAGEVVSSERAVVRLNTPLKVLTVETKPGQGVKADTVLFTVDVTDCALTVRELELSIAQLEQSLTPAGLTAAQTKELLAERDLIVAQMEKLYRDNPNGVLREGDVKLQMQQYELQLLRIDNQLSPAGLTAAQRELINRQRTLLLDKLEAYRATFPADGNVYAGVAGRLASLTVTAGTTLGAEIAAAEIIPVGSAQSVVLTLPQQQAEQLEPGDKAVLSYAKRVGTANVVATVNKQLTDKTYDEQSGQYRFTIALADEDAVAASAVSVRLVKSYGWYDLTVPLSAVTQTGQDSYCVHVLQQRDGLFGDEWYASMVEVGKLATDSLYMAVDAPALNAANATVIVSATATLYDGATVRVQRG